MQKYFTSIAAILGLIAIWCGLASALPGSTGSDRIVQDKQMGPYLGYGIAIHSADLRYPEAFDTIKPSFVRMEFGPDWAQVPETIPSGASIEEFEDYIQRNYNADGYDRKQNAKITQEFFLSRGTEIIKILFEVPFSWRTDDAESRIRPEHIEDLARFHTAHLRYLASIGVSPDYMELANEPDGFWNGHIPPADYNRLVLRCSRLFHENLESPPKILGPGLTFLNLHGWSPEYFAALEPEAVDALHGWSTHAWDEVEFQTSRPEYMYGVWQPFLDQTSKLAPEGQKPIFITEFATDALEYDGERFASPRETTGRNAVDEWPYAVRVVANSITHLNRGANALILYRLTNSHWHETGWGIIQPTSETEFETRPAYFAVSEMFSDLPADSVVLQPTWYQHDDPITLSALLHPDASITLLISNTSSTPQIKTLTLPKGKTAIDEKGGRSETGPFNPEITLARSELRIELPGQSIARVTIK